LSYIGQLLYAKLFMRI